MQKILIVEDDNDINHLLTELLAQNGYKVTSAYSGTEALLCFGNDTFDLILLDLMLPGKSGDVVLSEIRNISPIPVIALTAINTKESIVNLLKAGADDYITKPFDNDELLARIEARLRQSTPVANEEQALHYKDITLKPEQFDACIGDTWLHLSKREYEILKLLMEHPKKVFTKNNLYESVWQDEFMGDDNTINVHISKIRAKLAAVSPDKDYIQTVWGIGFKMQE